MTPKSFALITHTPLVSATDLNHLRGPLERSLQRVAAAHGRAAPAVVLHTREERLPRWCHPILFIDNDGHDPQSLADHYFDPVRSGPACRVFCEEATSFKSGAQSVSALTSHEANEALINPRLDLWVPWPGSRARPGVEIPVEVSDMLQDVYQEYFLGEPWPMANFAYPEYFDHRLSDPAQLRRLFESGGKLDELGELRAPGEIGADGYLILRDWNGASATGEHVWFEFDAHKSAGAVLRPFSQGKQHPMSRTAQLIKGVKAAVAARAAANASPAV